jgi:hypothetical protein
MIARPDKLAQQQPLLFTVEADGRRRVNVDEHAVPEVRRVPRDSLDLGG